MKNTFTSHLKIIFVIGLTFCITACTNKSPVAGSGSVPSIVGSWEGTVGDNKESIKLKPDSTFVCHVQPTGFLASTLSQPLSGTLHGNWKINGSTITLEVTKEKHEHTENTATTSTIVKLTKDSLVLRPDSGNVTVFKRSLQL